MAPNIYTKRMKNMANILAVDDEKAILNMIGNVLVKDSHTVTKIDDPTKIEMDKLSRFDLILLDVMMPGIDGFELCSKIRNVVDCPILFITAKTDEGSLRADRRQEPGF